jgi:hypothetical protein
MEMDEEEAARLLREQRNSETRLLSLPAEIRNQIYELLAKAETFETRRNRSTYTNDDSVHSLVYIQTDTKSIQVPRLKNSFRGAWKLLETTKVCRKIREELTSVIWSSVEDIELDLEKNWASTAAKEWIENTPFQRNSRFESLDIILRHDTIEFGFVNTTPRGSHVLDSYSRLENIGKRRAESYLAEMNSRPKDHVVTKRDIQTLIGYLVEESAVQRTKRQHKETRLRKKLEKELWISHGRRWYLHGDSQW